MPTVVAMVSMVVAVLMSVVYPIFNTGLTALGNAVSNNANAASLLSVMTLGVLHGEQVTLRAEGEGADRVLDGLAALLGVNEDAG